MSDKFVLSEVTNCVGYLTLDRPKALNSLSLEMVRAITNTLLAWQADVQIDSVVIHSSNEKAFCAGGDIRFFYDNGRATPPHGSALLEDFFSEEYALNHLIHHFTKPYVSVMDGIVMGGGMGIAQSGPSSRLRIVTDRTKMAMPEVNIGLFPDVGGSYFLSRCAGELGTYLGVTGDVIHAADALYAGLADVFIPTIAIAPLLAHLKENHPADIREAIEAYAGQFGGNALPAESRLAAHRAVIDTHFGKSTVHEIVKSLASDDSEFARQALAMIQKRSPLMMCVTLEEIRRGATMSLADCLRMERTMVRRSFEHGEVIEGVRAMVVDKDNTPIWNPGSLEDVSIEMVDNFFKSAWPDHAHPLRNLA